MRDFSPLRALLQLAVAVAIVVSTYYAIVGIAEYKADALAGGGAFVLDERQVAENAAFDALLAELREWGELEFAAALARLRASGHLWIAPRLTGGRSAIYVNSLGLVSWVYLRRDVLVARILPFADPEIPEAAQRTFATIRLAGTLFHELQHYQGVKDERVAYEREMDWYRRSGRVERREALRGGGAPVRVGGGLRPRKRVRREPESHGHAKPLTAGVRGCYKCVTVVPAPIPPGRSRTSR